jgi:ferredoxin
MGIESVEYAGHEALPSIDVFRCTGCGRCVAACRPNLLSLEKRGWVKTSVLHDLMACTGCGACESACPYGVIGMVEEAREAIA